MPLFRIMNALASKLAVVRSRWWDECRLDLHQRMAQRPNAKRVMRRRVPLLRSARALSLPEQLAERASKDLSGRFRRKRRPTGGDATLFCRTTCVDEPARKRR